MRTFRLRKNEIQLLSRKHASSVKVLHGAVWITGNPLDGDVILQANATFNNSGSVSGKYSLVIQGLEDSEVMIDETTEENKWSETSNRTSTWSPVLRLSFILQRLIVSLRSFE